MRWKVVEQKGGTVCYLAGHDARFRPAADERLIVEVEAKDNGEASVIARKLGLVKSGPYGDLPINKEGH